jgi:hypothetical protein
MRTSVVRRSEYNKQLNIRYARLHNGRVRAHSAVGFSKLAVLVIRLPCVQCEQCIGALTWLLLYTVAPYSADRLNRCSLCGFAAVLAVVLGAVVVGTTAALTPVCWPAMQRNACTMAAAAQSMYEGCTSKSQLEITVQYWLEDTYTTSRHVLHIVSMKCICTVLAVLAVAAL